MIAAPPLQPHCFVQARKGAKHSRIVQSIFFIKINHIKWMFQKFDIFLIIRASPVVRHFTSLPLARPRPLPLPHQLPLHQFIAGGSKRSNSSCFFEACPNFRLIYRSSKTVSWW